MGGLMDLDEIFGLRVIINEDISLDTFLNKMLLYYFYIFRMEWMAVDFNALLNIAEFLRYNDGEFSYYTFESSVCYFCTAKPVERS